MGGFRLSHPADPSDEQHRLKEERQRRKFYLVLGIFIFIVSAYFLWSLGISKWFTDGSPVTGYMIYAPSDQQPVCKSPYITVCCLDENSNNICDSEEERISQQQASGILEN